MSSLLKLSLSPLLVLILDIVNCVAQQNLVREEIELFEQVNQKCKNGFVDENAGTVFEVVGGIDATRNRFPYVVSLQISHPSNPATRYAHWCGGSLVTNSLILTAAHCVFAQGVDFRMEGGGFEGSIKKGELFGALNPYCRHMAGEGRHAVVEYFVNEGFNGNSVDGDDIAILKVDPPFDYQGPFINYGASSKLQLQEYGVFTTLGWGATNISDRILNNYIESIVPMQMGFLSFWDRDECQQSIDDMYIDQELDPQQVVCFQSSGTDTCWGDSGSPVLLADGNYGLDPRADPANDVIVGISSWGPEINCAGVDESPGVYTRVENYIGWINNIITNNLIGNQKANQVQILQEDPEISIAQVLYFDSPLPLSSQDELSPVVPNTEVLSEENRQITKQNPLDDISPPSLSLSNFHDNLNRTLDVPSPQNIPSSSIIQYAEILSVDYSSHNNHTEDGDGSAVPFVDQNQVSQNGYEIQITEILFFDPPISDKVTENATSADELLETGQYESNSLPIALQRPTQLIEVDQQRQQLEIFEPDLEEFYETVEGNEVLQKLDDQDQYEEEQEAIMRKIFLQEPSIKQVCLVNQKQERVGQIIKAVSVEDTGGCCRACLQHHRCNAYLYCSEREGCITSDGWMIFHTQCLLQLMTWNQELKSLGSPISSSEQGLVSGRILS